jgi:hypothetical protein
MMTDKKIDKPTPIVKVGDKVMFSRYRGINSASEGRVTRVGRIWIDVAHPNTERLIHAGRFRLDTQTDGTGTSAYAARFWTMDQYAEVMRERDAQVFLRDQGVRISWDPSWPDPCPWTATTLAGALRLARSIGDPAKLLELIEEYGIAMRDISQGVVGSSTRAGQVANHIKLRLGLSDDQRS